MREKKEEQVQISLSKRGGFVVSPFMFYYITTIHTLHTFIDERIGMEWSGRQRGVYFSKVEGPCEIVIVKQLLKGLYTNGRYITFACVDNKIIHSSSIR
ncbi:hypothetical protein BJX63DRAFT_201976 [Aspergillus granulosus]|uniref:Uncharacterized protein n=1 Tax=Aspergillus granulosus TaxID=176169 RepID=A0ABR4HFP6_9EURO